MQALQIHAGPQALKHLREHGLQAAHVGIVPGAAGGPKGLILGPLDRFIFGQWLPQSSQPVHLVGASIGAWRLATACLNDPANALAGFEQAYIQQHYALPPGQKRHSADQVSREFGRKLQDFYAGKVDQVLQHPRYRLHVLASRGRHLLRREHGLLTPLGYAGAYVANAFKRAALAGWLERVVFSSAGDLPFSTHDFRTRQVLLTPANFMPAVQASCAIPFALRAVHDIPGAPPGAYWDGGLTDYHLHLHYAPPAHSPIVLYPHFQKEVVPGWLDKAWRQRHRATPALDAVVVLSPRPEWIRQRLPKAKLPDRGDFNTYGQDWAARAKVWQGAASAAQQLSDEFAQWLTTGHVDQVQPL